MTYFQRINVQLEKLHLGRHNYLNNARWPPEKIFIQWEKLIYIKITKYSMGIDLSLIFAFPYCMRQPFTYNTKLCQYFTMLITCTGSCTFMTQKCNSQYSQSNSNTFIFRYVSTNAAGLSVYKSVALVDLSSTSCTPLNLTRIDFYA